MTVATRRTIVVIGWMLVGLTFASLFAVALIATLEGGGAVGVDFRGSGKPVFFTPVLYIPLLLAFFGVGGYWIWRQVRKHPSSGQASNPTPHADARDQRSASHGQSSRAPGGRER